MLTAENAERMRVTYQKSLTQAEALLHLIGRALDDEARVRTPDFGHIGNIEYTNEHLSEVYDFLTGQGEYEA